MKKLLLLSLTILLFSCGDNDSIDETPIINLIGEAIVTVEIYSTYTDAGATAQDTEDGNLTSSITTTGLVNTSMEGNYVITYTVSDSSGNTATTSRQVIVEDVNPVYLAENGVTIKAKDWALIGDSGVVNGIGYTIVDNETLRNMISNGDDVTRVCTSRIVDMEYMFNNALDFNQDIGSWDVSIVTNMNGMFRDASSFNQPLNDWNTSNVIDMGYMFLAARKFNQPLNKWDVEKVTDMYVMFQLTDDFNQNLSSWNVDGVINCEDFNSQSSLTEANLPNFTNCNI